MAGRAAARQIAEVAPHATAVLISNEFAALGLVSGLRRLGRRIPDDVSVLSVLTSEEMSVLTDPTLTVMSSPGVELGQLAVQALLRMLAGQPALPPQLLPGVLRPGESTGPAPGGQGAVG